MNKIAKIINDWDPIGFFPMAPEDEYSNEIEKIYDFIYSNQELDVPSLATAIYEIFMETFGEDIYDSDMEQCTQIAIQLLNSNILDS